MRTTSRFFNFYFIVYSLWEKKSFLLALLLPSPDTFMMDFWVHLSIISRFIFGRFRGRLSLPSLPRACPSWKQASPLARASGKADQEDDQYLEASALGPSAVATGPGLVGLVLTLGGRPVACGSGLGWAGQAALACEHIFLLYV